MLFIMAVTLLAFAGVLRLFREAMAELGERTRGEVFEGIAFQFCKVATVVLLTGRWALPIAAGLCAVFFLLAHFNGKRDTRCLLRSPLLAALVFALVCGGSLYWTGESPLFRLRERGLGERGGVASTRPTHRRAPGLSLPGPLSHRSERGGDLDVPLSKP